MIFLDCSMCMMYNSSPRHWVASLLPISNKVFSWSLGQGTERQHACTTYFAKSKIGSNGENKAYNQIKMCMCVEYFQMKLAPPFFMTLSFILRRGLSLFYFIFFSYFMLRARIYFFFFCIAHTLLHDGESRQSDGVSFCMWMEDMFLRNFQCRSQHEYMWSLCDLDLKSMK